MISHVTGRLSVNGVAEVAGVTPRTVRYYHSIGLVPEPPRDSSGYRRYGGKEVVELVRVVRLRALGMPLPQIAQRVAATAASDTAAGSDTGSGSDTAAGSDAAAGSDTGSAAGSDSVSLPDALSTLADELDAEIDRLVATRDRLRDLAGSDTFDQPVKTLTQALQDEGVFGPADHLRTGEKWAAAVLDALHPGGMPGVLAQASGLLGDPTVIAALGPLRGRLRNLGPRSSDAEIAGLAADVAAVLASGDVGSQVDLGLVDLLLTDRLNPTQQRFMHDLQGRMHAR